MNILFIKKLFYGRKVTIIYIIIFLIINCVIFGIQGCDTYIEQQISNIENSTHNRLISIITDKNINNINSNKIKKIYRYFTPFYCIMDEIYTIKLNPEIKEVIPPIIKGKYFNKDKKNEVILPDSLIINNQKKSTIKYLNKHITINIAGEYNHQNIKLKVVGIYKSKGFNDFYISQKNSYIKETVENKKEYVILVKKNVNVEDFRKELSDTDETYFFDESAENELNVYMNLQYIVKVIYIFFFIINIITVILIIKDLIDYISLDIAIIKVFGYTSANILAHILLGIYIVLIIPLLCFYILMSLILSFLDILSCSIIYPIIIKTILLNITLILICGILYVYKIRKISIIELLK